MLKSLFGWITGGGNSANNALSTTTKMLDNAFYTNQEKAVNNNKMMDWYLKYQEATAPQNVSRRVIALMVTGMWCLLIITAVVARLFETTVTDNSFSNFVFNTLKENINTPFSIIIGFYFAAHILKGLKNGK